MNGMFCLVDFKGGRKKTVVPDTWLSINDTLCLLPPNATNSDLEVLVRNLVEPGQGWQMLEVSSLETFESYSDAKRQLEKSKATSYSEQSTQRKRKKPSYLEEYSTHDSDDGRTPYTVFGGDFDEEAMSENEWIPPPEFSPRIEKVSAVKRAIPNDHRPRNHRFSQSQLLSRKENIDFTCDCQSSCHGSFLQVLHSMQKQLDRTNRTVQQLLGGQKQTHSQLKRVLQNLPANQMNAQEEIDVFSQDSSNFVQCVLQSQSTPATQKGAENATTSSAAENTDVTGDQPSTAEVLEMDFKESLKNQIKLALEDIQTEDIEKVLTTLDNLGAENKDDLTYVRSTDLLDVLSEVQAKKLIESFQTSSESDVQSLIQLEPQPLLLQNDTKFPEAEKDCIINISWERMSPELLDDLKSNKEPSPFRYREMVRVIADDLMKYPSKLTKYVKSSVAESCVNKYPILKDKFEGTVIGTGFETLTRRLDARIDNMKRNHSISLSSDCNKKDKQNLKIKKKNTISLASYGCVAWAPNIPNRKTLDSLEKKKKCLLEMKISKDYEKIGVLMQDTYSLQRKEINDGTDIKYLLSEWPFLFEMQGMLDHFKVLTGIDMRQKIESIMDERCKVMFAFLRSCDKIKVTEFMADKDTTRNKLVLLFVAIALYFDEDPSECIRNYEVQNRQDNPKEIPFHHPCLIGKGISSLKAKEFMICVDKEIVNSEIKDANFAVMMLFATYYVLNLAYPRSIALTLEFFQRGFIGINPWKGSKIERKGKYYQISPRLLKAMTKISHFEDRWKKSTKI